MTFQKFDLFLCSIAVVSLLEITTADPAATGETTESFTVYLASSTSGTETSEIGEVNSANTSAISSTLPPKTSQNPIKEIHVFTEDFSRVETPFLIGMWIFCASIAKIGFHMSPKLNKVFPESCLLIVIGVVIGFLLFMSSNVHVSPLTPNTFFLYMLPPIILDAGYFMPNRLFFDHLGTILLFAVVGTIFNTITIGVGLWLVGLTGLFGCDPPILEVFLFSALISAVDPVAVLAVFEEIHVNEILYIVVFGESLLNDAVTVVLYHMFEAYSEMGPSNIMYTDILKGFASFFVVAIGGTVIGVLWGFLTGLVTRYTHEVRVIEPIFIFVMAYLAYLNAEIFHMSGILAITFCGITMKNYVEANISHKSHTTVKYAMKMLSSSSETIIFMFLGVATVNDSHDWNTWFVILTIAFCSIFRALGVIILTSLANHFRLNKLSRVDEFVMSYGGLRGAVAFALVLLINPEHVKLQPMFVTTTIAVIYFTVFFQGITIKPLVKLLKVRRAEKRKCTMNERIHERFMDHLMAGIEEIVGAHGNHHIRDKFKRFDNKFIRPYLLRNHQGAEPKILETYSKLAMKDAIDLMQRNPSSAGNIAGAESMSAIFRNYTAQNLNSSFTQLDASTWNIDLQELEYNPSKKDMTDAKIHHLLSEELCKPRRHRRLSYSRHAVRDLDLSTQEVNYKMHMNIRKVLGERRHHHHKRSKKTKDGKQNHVSFPELQQNGTSKTLTNDFLEVVLQGNEDEESKRDEWDGITFTARSSPSGSASGLLTQITSLPGFDPTRARLVKQYSKPYIDYDDAPTVAEVSLPWRRNDDEFSRDSCDDIRELPDHYGPSPVNVLVCVDDCERLTPTATESLPWKREDSDSALSSGPVLQSEFPAWCANKEYLAYNSPSVTFLGGIEKPKTTSVIGLFRRESTGSVKGHRSRANSDSSVLTGVKEGGPSSVILIEEGLGVAGSNSSNSSACSRRPLIGRRGSMLELSGSVDPIPEEEVIAGSIAVMSPHNSLPSLTDGLPGHRRANAASLTPFTTARRNHSLGQKINSSDSSCTSVDEPI